MNKANRPYPEDSYDHVAYYDSDRVLEFYDLNDSKPGQPFYHRHFVKKVCERLNDGHNQVMIKGLQLLPRFDQLPVTSNKRMICRFSLPLEDGMKKNAVAFLFEMAFQQEIDTWIERVVCDQRHFIMMSHKIT